MGTALKKAEDIWQWNVMHEPLLDTGSKKKKPIYLEDNWKNMNMGSLLDDVESMSNFLDVIVL